MSLPHKLGINLKTIPSLDCYKSIEIPNSRINQFRKKIVDNGRLNIGLVWAGNPKHHNDQNRSMDIEALGQGILKLPANFISLMKEFTVDTKSAMAQYQIIDFHEELEDFTDTAALVINMDIILTVDTSVAHLAAALGMKVWLLIPFAPDWRWLLSAETSPWYPNVRIFRQSKPHDWTGALQKVEQELQALIKNKNVAKLC
jgi:hypothetical protein